MSIAREVAVKMYGADAEGLEGLARQIDAAAVELERIARTVRSSLYTVRWPGPLGDRTRSDWDRLHARRLRSASSALKAASGKLRVNAQEQRQTSAAAPSHGPSLLGYAGLAGLGGAILPAMQPVVSFLGYLSKIGGIRENLTLTRGLAEASFGRLKKLRTGQWPKTFWRGTGRIGALAKKGNPTLSILTDATTALYWYNRNEGAKGDEFWSSSFAGSYKIVAFAVAGPPGVVAASLGFEVVDGIELVSEKVTGKTASEHWGSWAYGSKFDEMHKMLDRKDELTLELYGPEKSSMSAEAIAQRKQEFDAIDRQLMTKLEKAKNPKNVLLSFIGIGR